ncbi:MAG: hypothetical protein MZV64_70515 [Ignavibacteriales bacterium]|nr:hypothetical protein [Ignavibacteriales bacterium]
MAAPPPQPDGSPDQGGPPVPSGQDRDQHPVPPRVLNVPARRPRHVGPGEMSGVRPLLLDTLRDVGDSRLRGSLARETP